MINSSQTRVQLELNPSPFLDFIMKFPYNFLVIPWVAFYNLNSNLRFDFLAPKIFEFELESEFESSFNFYYQTNHENIYDEFHTL